MKTKKRLTDEDKQALKDAKWWRETAAIIGCTLHGFTYRHVASFHNPTMTTTVEIPGWLAEKIRGLAAES
jgi:hypothetical protein